MPAPLEADGRVSEELSIVLEALVNDPEVEGPVTLGLARDRVKQMIEGGKRSPDRKIGSEQSIYAELEALIEEFGEDAPAEDFITVKASEGLSDVIEALLDASDEENLVTLQRVREEIDRGFAALLEGGGVLEADEEQALRAELDALIERYGPDTPAEDLLRFE